MQPILHSRSVDNTGQYLFVSCLDEDQKGVLVSLSNFCGQTDFGQSTDEPLELLCRARLVYPSQYLLVVFMHQRTIVVYLVAYHVVYV